MPFARLGARAHSSAAAATNLCLQSQTFDDASWTKNQGTVTANAIAAPDGTTTADAFIPISSGAADSYLNRSTTITAAAYTFSVHMKNGTLGNNWLQVLILGSGTWEGFFNLATGSAGTANGATSTIAAMGNGWYRVTVTFTSASTSTTTYLAARGANNSSATIPGNGTSPAYYAWGAQMERGVVATAYIPTTTASVTRPPRGGGVASL